MDEFSGPKATSNQKIYIPIVDTEIYELNNEANSNQNEKEVKLEDDKTNRSSSTSKKGFLSNLFSRIKFGAVKKDENKSPQKVSAVDKDNCSSTSKEKLGEFNGIDIKCKNVNKKKKFADAAKVVLESIREEKRKRKKAKFEAIVDMLMSQKAYYMSLISKSERSGSGISKLESKIMKNSVSCPAHLNILQNNDENINDNSCDRFKALSCSCGSNLMLTENSDTKNEIAKNQILSSESSFESTESCSNINLNTDSEKPIIKRRYLRKNMSMSGNHNKAIVRQSIKKTFKNKLSKQKSIESELEELDVKEKVWHIQNNDYQLQQIYLCAFQVVLHPETYEPVIIWINPEYTKIDDLYNYRDFCFPELKSYYKNYKWKDTDLKTYQFVRTKIDGTKEYGYCRKYIHPKANKNELPIVFCLVSKVDSYTMYDQILEELGLYYQKQDIDFVHLFLICLHTKPLPKPDGPVSYMKLNHDRYLILQRNMDNRLTNTNSDILLRFLSIENIIKVVTAILNEKSVIVFSHKLSVLSRVMDAIRSLLYPFSWPYSYVPVLPSHLIDHCESPSPYLFGVIADNFESISKMELNHTILVHLNRNKLYNYDQIEINNLPDELTKSLIKLCKKVKLLFRRDKFLELTISEGFLYLFIELFHNYNEFITENKEFKLKEFISSHEDSSYKWFLVKFSETSLFHNFIINFVENPVSKTFFEEKIAEYKQDKGSKFANKVFNNKYFFKKTKQLNSLIFIVRNENHITILDL